MRSDARHRRRERYEKKNKVKADAAKVATEANDIIRCASTLFEPKADYPSPKANSETYTNSRESSQANLENLPGGTCSGQSTPNSETYTNSRESSQANLENLPSETRSGQSTPNSETYTNSRESSQANLENLHGGNEQSETRLYLGQSTNLSSDDSDSDSDPDLYSDFSDFSLETQSETESKSTKRVWNSKEYSALTPGSKKTYIRNYNNSKQKRRRQKMYQKESLIEKWNPFLLPRTRLELTKFTPSTILYSGMEILSKQLTQLRMSEFAQISGIRFIFLKGQNTRYQDVCVWSQNRER